MKKNYLLKEVLLITLDIIFVFSSMLFSLKLFECLNINKIEIYIYGLIEALILFILFANFKLYKSIWKFVGIIELINISISVLIITLINSLFGIFTDFTLFPYGFPIVNGLFILASTGFIRFLPRIINYYESKKHILKNNSNRIMIIGAGAAGVKIIREMLESENIDKIPVCVIDDDLKKINSNVYNVPVVGTTNDIVEFAEKYNISEIIFAIPSISPKEKSKILNICKETNCKVKVLPGIYELVNGTVSINKIRDVEIEDLLGREQVNINSSEIKFYIEKKVVLVTGGGGSIGSELCRQIVKFNPKKLIILDIYENNAYDIEQELKKQYPNLDLLVLIASVRDKIKINKVFNDYKPEIVFNAAAHKHVPLMETSPNEAIKNNVFGTLNVALAANQYGTKKFVQISTDKAVNPTNIMGASKRICEMIIQAIGRKSNSCEFVAVRFGNVLGSNGSVIPLFKKQIAEGGPVTVTHKDIIRYFMTIPEAVSLVLQAGVYAKGGEIFVLDMGEPVRIYDLAENLIKLSGFTPNVDIEIAITGLRPGEKLYEERLMKEEGLKETANGMISVARPIDFDENLFFEKLDVLKSEVNNESDKMIELVKELVHTYKITK